MKDEGNIDMKVLLIVNPHSGKGQSQKYSQQLQDKLQSIGHDVDLRLSQSEDDIYDWSSQAHTQGYDWVICSGGDGTVNQTINGLMSHDERPSFGFLPLGTVNDLGRALKYPGRLENIIAGFEDITVKTIDVGEINGQYFATTCAVGSLAESVMNTTSEDKNKMGKLAYIRDGLNAVMTENGHLIDITDSRGQRESFQTNLVVIGLTNSVGGFEQMNSDAKVDDGLLHLTAVRGVTMLDMTQALFEGKLFAIDSDKLFTLKDTEVTLTTQVSETLTTNIDGDPGPTLPVTIRVIPKALNVLIPKTKDIFQALQP